MRLIDDLRDNPQAMKMATDIGMDNIQILAGALREGQIEDADRDPDRNINAMNAVLTTVRAMTEGQVPLSDNPLALSKQVADVLFQHQPERMREVHKALEEHAAKKEPLGHHTAQLAAKTSNPERGRSGRG